MGNCTDHRFVAFGQAEAFDPKASDISRAPGAKGDVAWETPEAVADVV
jgi:hypothetical protein